MKPLLSHTCRRWVALLCAGAVSLVLSACSDQLTKPKLTGSAAQNAGNFSNVVFLGDSLTAGFQNGSLLDTQQPNDWAALVAAQAQFTIKQPLMAYPGVPNVMKLTSIGPPPVMTTVPGVSTGRDDLRTQPTNLAVPGHVLYDVLHTQPSLVPSTDEQTITYLVLGFPGIDQGVQYSQAQWAAQLNPTTIFLWIGNNDALVACETGKPASMTALADFTAEYTELIQYLQTNTRASLIVANIPDVTSVPYLTSGAVVLAEYAAATHYPTTTLSALFGIQATDLVNPTGLSEISAIIAGTRKTPVGDEGFLSAAEQTQVQSMVLQYNSVIAAQVSAAGGTLVDIHGILTQLKAAPPTINGVKPGFTFLGGIFGLDGIHPTNTGYAMVANAFIDTINARLGKSISEVNVSAIAAKDPYYPTNLTVSSSHIPSTARLTSILNPQGRK